MNKQVIIVGASGHGRVVADIVRSAGNQVLGFLDDNPNLPEKISGIPYLGLCKDYVNYPDAEFLIAIGNAQVRKMLAQRMEGVKWHTAIHPSAVISSMDTAIGEGTVVMANAVVNPGAVVGKHCILNTASVVEHDDRIADYVHISVGAKLGGGVAVGQATWVGIGAAVCNNMTICENCMIGAGAVVVRNLEVPGTYVGVPARKKK